MSHKCDGPQVDWEHKKNPTPPNPEGSYLKQFRFETIAKLSKLVVVCVFCTVGCESPSPSDNAINVQTEIDFGNIGPAVVENMLSVRNENRQSIQILSIQSTCQCAVVSEELPLNVPGNSEVTLSVKLDASGLVGPVARSIVLKTGPPDSRYYRTRISAFVEREQTPLVSPSTIDLGTFGDWELPNREVRLMRLGTMSLTVNSIECFNPSISLNLDRREGPNYVYRLVIDDDLGDGLFDERIVLRTSSGEVLLRLKGNHINGRFYVKSGIVTLTRDSDHLSGTFVLQHANDFNASECVLSSDLGSVKLLGIDRQSPLKSRLNIEILQDDQRLDQGRFRIESERGTHLYEFDCFVLKKGKTK